MSDDAETFLYPRRFYSARERNERLGRWLRIVAGVPTVDERLLDRLGRWMFARDELLQLALIGGYGSLDRPTCWCEPVA